MKINFLGLLVLTLASFTTAHGLTVTDLRCEYLRDPLGLDVTEPRLSWLLKASSETARNENQSAYHILVASSQELLAQDKGDLWDSGEVKSDKSADVVYDGGALKSRQGCFWKVRVTDSTGQATAWSPMASWEMGLLKPEDWQAKWISAHFVTPGARVRGGLAILQASYEAVDGAGTNDVTAILAGLIKDSFLSTPINNGIFRGDPAPNHAKRLQVNYSIDGEAHKLTAMEGATLTIPGNRNPIPYLRKDFSLKKSITKARVFATALGLYEMRLNGQRVGDHVFAPDWTDYNKRVRYQVYDVTPMVKEGANTLAGLVANGWYSGHIGNGHFQAWGTVPALFAQLEVTYSDGSVDTIVTDGSWKAHESPTLSSDLVLGEDYDAQREIAGWDQPGLDVSDWIPVVERSESDRPFDGQVDQPVRQIGELHPKSVKEPKPGQYTYDLGQNMVGVVRLKITAPAGTEIVLRHGEMLNPDGTLYTENLRAAASTDTYICKGGGMETWQPRFTFHGFRYVELTGLPLAPGNDAVTGVVLGTDIPATGEFSCSLPDINQLQSNIQWGMRGNYLSVPTDCPQRDERMGWMGDAQVFIRTACYNGDVAAFFTKWLADVDDAQGAAGDFTDISPTPPRKGTARPGAPGWGDAGVICPWTIYLMYGDKRILEQHLPAMARWIDFCQAQNPSLIRNVRSYGDWLSQGENTSKELIGTAYFAYSTSLVAKAYRVIGDNASADKYQQLFEQIKAAFDQRYVGADGHIRGGTQCAYCMALKFNLLSDDLRAKAGQYLEDNVKAHGDHLTTGFIGVSYLLPSLSSENKIDTAYRVFEQDTFPSWLFSVKQGATTIWERWDGWTPEQGFQSPKMNSFNHYSLGSCGEWMFDTVAGIGVDPDQPGFKHVIIRPRPGGTLTHAEGSFESMYGTIATKWTQEKSIFALDVTLPVNTTGTIELPTSNDSSVQEGGTNLSSHPEIKSVPGEKGKMRLQIGSGTYQFTCETSS